MAGQVKWSGRRPGRFSGRLLSLLLVVWAVTLATFLLANLLPGDPVLAMLGENATPEAIAHWRGVMGLDQPLVVRYGQWLWSLLHGDLGISYWTQDGVMAMILRRLPVTLELLVLTQILALSVAIPSAIISAWRRGSGFDRSVQSSALGLLSMPPFLIGILLIFAFSVHLGWLPATGFVPLSQGMGANLASVILPVLALALAEFPIYTRLLRADLVQTLQQDYIAVAHAKGMPSRRILLQHALRPSSFTLLTVVGVNIGRLIGGTVIIEQLFALPGIGQMLVQAVYQQDYMVLQGIVLFVAVGFVLINALVDALYFVLDPRTRHE